jgi:hypothetical protein
MDKIIEEIFEHGSSDPEAALQVLLNFGQTDGAHHKLWTIDQAVRHLAGNRYNELITAYKNGEDGPESYQWEEGIAP